MARSTYNADRTEKRCCTCKAMLPVANYRETERLTRKGEMKTYHRAECRKCTRLRVSRWRKANLDKTRAARTAYARLWRERNAEKYRAYQAEYHRTYERPVPPCDGDFSVTGPPRQIAGRSAGQQPTFEQAMALLRQIAQIPATK
jgi:hypothetical protein